MDFYRGIIVQSSNPTSKILKADPFCMLTTIFISAMDLNPLLSQVPAYKLNNLLKIVNPIGKHYTLLETLLMSIELCTLMGKGPSPTL